jgi:Tol biopolymer transport system component
MSEIPKIYIVGLDGSQPRDVLANFLSGFESVRVAWHPDGKRVSIWGKHRELGWSLWTVPLSGGVPIKSELTTKVKEQFKDANVELTDFLWSSSGHTLYFEGISRRVRNIWKVEIDPQTLTWISGPDRITTGTGMETDMAISPDGKKLAFTERLEHTRLWSIPFDASAGKVKGPGQPITPVGVEASLPDISANGQKLSYMVQRAGKWELWERSLRDGRETMLSSDGVRKRLRWSPDGTRLAYSRIRMDDREQTRSEFAIMLLPADGGEEQIVTTPSLEGATISDWSSDGKLLLGGCQGSGPSGRSLCTFPLSDAPHAETGMHEVASHKGENIYQARFSPDNRWISFCVARTREAGTSTVYVISPSGGEWQSITENRYFDDKPRWSPDGRTLYFVSNRTGFFNVWGIRFDSENGRPIGEPFRVTSFENPGQMILSDVRTMDMALTSDRMILPIMEVSGGIWILENVAQ